MNASNADLIERRGRRTIATILGFKDRYLDEFLPEEVGEDFRELVLDQVNDLIHLAVDCLKAETGEQNDIYLTLLQEIRDSVTDT